MRLALDSPSARLAAAVLAATTLACNDNAPVTVVSAGAKAILDIPKTLEALETRGVPVIAFGQSELPAFWSRSSGIDAPLRMDSAQAIADLMARRTAQEAFAHGGILIANPVPADAEIPLEEMSVLIDETAGSVVAKDQSILGHDLATGSLLWIREPVPDHFEYCVVAGERENNHHHPLDPASVLEPFA